ncbi:MAG: prepilin peptidase [Acidimicrobiales bacterium]
MTPWAASRVAAIVGSGVVGLAVGSFLNVVAYRVPRAMSVIRPASHCPSCRARLTALDTVPVLSWVVLGGRCRHCRAPVSSRYPVVEAVTGAAFAALAAAVGGLDPLASAALVVACAIAAALVDADRAPVPMALGAVAGTGAASLVVVAAVLAQPGRIGWAVLGGALTGTATVVADRAWPRPGDAAVLSMAAPAASGRWAVLAALGVVAGWLWPPGGAVAAAWVALAAAGGWSRPGARHRWSAPLGVLAAGAFGAVLVAAALGRS